MTGYIVVDKKEEALNGTVDFNRLGKNIYSNLGEAIANMTNNQCVMEFEFLDDEEVMNAINAAVIGKVCSKFAIQFQASYHKTVYS
jgi:hypothetical protein